MIKHARFRDNYILKALSSTVPSVDCLVQIMVNVASYVILDETAVKINGEWSWLYAAINLGTKLILGVDLFGTHGTDPAAAFLHGLSEKHDLSEAVFLVDGFGYQTVLARLELSIGVIIQTGT